MENICFPGALISVSGKLTKISELFFNILPSTYSRHHIYICRHRPHKREENKYPTRDLALRKTMRVVALRVWNTELNAIVSKGT